MKELSIKEKAKRYDDAIERAKNTIKVNQTIPDIVECVEFLFPELAESEDERIRKALIKLVKKAGEGYENVSESVSIQKAISWLEKQGEQKPAPDWMLKFLDELRSKKNYFDWDEHRDIEGGILAIIEWMNPNYFYGKDGGQKPAYKVEPKFHKGEWLCENELNNYARFIQILEIVNVQGKERYRISRDIHNDEDIVEFDFVEKYYHKFDIKDAKDGDVLEFGDHGRLVVGIVSYINKTTGKVDVNCLLENNNFKVGNYYNLDTIKPHPATKEQRDTLMNAIVYAGYEWDSEMKKLKKIEQMSAEWSEDDEEMHRKCICAMKASACGFPEEEKFVEQVDNWIKSLQCRVQPQSQSDERNRLLGKLEEWLDEYVSDLADVDTATLICSFSNYLDGKLPKSIRPQKQQEWSEEDERFKIERKAILNDVIAHLRFLASIEKDKVSASYIQRDIDWTKENLPFLRPQSTWKPSEEQIKALMWVRKNIPYNIHKENLNGLLEQLKKLREE